MAQLTSAGARRIALGSYFSTAANAAIINAAVQLRDEGTIEPVVFDRQLLRTAFTA